MLHTVTYRVHVAITLHQKVQSLSTYSGENQHYSVW